MEAAVSHFGSAMTSRGNGYEHGRGGTIGEAAIDLRPKPYMDTPARLALVEVDQVLPRERSERISRALNVTVAVVALVLCLPLLALVALMVRLTSRGPILYSQVRVGVDRRFRSQTGSTIAVATITAASCSRCTSSARCASTPRPDGRRCGRTKSDPRDDGPSASSFRRRGSTSCRSCTTSFAAT